MGGIVVGSYDVAMLVTEPGLERLVRTMLLEGPGRNGLPFELPVGEFGTLRIGLASVRMAPTRTVPVEYPFQLDGTPTQEAAPDALGIRLALAHMNEPDKYPTVLDVEAQIAAEIVANPPAFFEGLTDIAGLREFFGRERCPSDSHPPSSPPRIVHDAPARIDCVDAQFRLANGPVVPVSLLALRAKISPLAVAAGTEDDPALLDVSQVAAQRDVTIIVSNRYLREELFPSWITEALLTAEAQRRAAELREDLLESNLPALWEQALLLTITDEVETDTEFLEAARSSIEAWLAANQPDLTGSDRVRQRRRDARTRPARDRPGHRDRSRPRQLRRGRRRELHPVLAAR